jgi:hypothetical protein
MLAHTCFLAVLGTVLVAQSPLATFGYGNNSGAVDGAVYFDLTAQAALTVTGIDVVLASGSGIVQVYRCAGTHIGQESNAAAWSLIGSGSVQNRGQFDWSPVSLAQPITVPAGGSGIAFVASGAAFSYWNVVPGLPTSYETEELRLDAGAASNVPFTAPTFATRVVCTRIRYSDPGTGFARRTDYGLGCAARVASFCEAFQYNDQLDLANRSFRMVPANGGYDVVPGGAWRPLSPAAVSLGLGDESTAIRSFAGVFHFPGGTTSSFEVGSNGTVSAGPNGFGFEGAPATLLDRPHAAWVVWRDFAPTPFGNVWWEESQGIVSVTYLGVLGYVGGYLGSGQSWFQLQFDIATGAVTFVFGAMDPGGGYPYDYVVGYSPGGPSVDPGEVDLSAPGLSVQLGATDVLPLHLTASARPVQGAAIDLQVQNSPALALFGGITFGLADPALDLTSLGMPGCRQYTDALATVLFFVPSGGVPPIPFTVPLAAGVELRCQAILYAPGSALTPLGAVASQGLQLTIGSF